MFLQTTEYCNLEEDFLSHIPEVNCVHAKALRQETRRLGDQVWMKSRQPTYRQGDTDKF